MDHDLSLSEMKKEWHGTLKSYAIGFVASLLLTSTSFALVLTDIISKEYLIASIVALAIIQAVVQLIYFLHLGQEAKPRWETLIFFFMLLLLSIIALGTLWVMHDLNERTMSMTMQGMTHD